MGRRIIINFVEHLSATEALQFLETTDHDRAILIGGKYWTMTQADFDNLESLARSSPRWATTRRPGSSTACQRTGGSRDGQTANRCRNVPGQPPRHRGADRAAANGTGSPCRACRCRATQLGLRRQPWVGCAGRILEVLAFLSGRSEASIEDVLIDAQK